MRLITRYFFLKKVTVHYKTMAIQNQWDKQKHSDCLFSKVLLDVNGSSKIIPVSFQILQGWTKFVSKHFNISAEK